MARKQGEQPDFIFLSYAPNTNRKSQGIQDSQGRAHAARKSHALAKQRRGVFGRSSSEDTGSPASPESPKNSSPKQSTPNDVVLFQPCEDPNEVKTIDGHDGSESMAQHGRIQIWSGARSIPATPYLGQGATDPFDAFAVKNLPSYVYKVLDIGKQ